MAEPAELYGSEVVRKWKIKGGKASKVFCDRASRVEHRSCTLQLSRRPLNMVDVREGNPYKINEQRKKYVQENTSNISCQISSLLHDRMTDCRYDAPLNSFDIEITDRSFFEINIMKNGKAALIDANERFGLALDDFDIDYYYDIFSNKVNRNPTNVELFDLAQSNSEHSRHWFFKGRLIIDGLEINESLFKMVMQTQNHTNQNSVIKFKDNSSAIRGSKIPVFKPSDPSECSPFLKEDSIRHITYTAETHNFPTGICPFPGAATGTGGRIRDGHATGRGSYVVAGIAGYSFGNLNIANFHQPWEDGPSSYPFNFAKPLEICIQASNGASDYGNKFGEPVICGFTRSFGMYMENGERIEYVKPIMFSGGMGTIDDGLVEKISPKKGMIVAKIGGPIYRIGVGGGSASSVDMPKIVVNHWTSAQFNAATLKWNKKIVENAGAKIYADKFELGDPTINALELWGAEYQESDAILIEKKGLDAMKKICQRERCPLSCVGEIADDNKIILVDFRKGVNDPRPVDMDLNWVLGAVPRKTYNLTKKRPTLPILSLPKFDFCHFLKRVLNLPSVASKRYLTNKVDRCVTGLIAQQQCVGCLHTPLADVAVTALSYFDTVGSAVAVGEQPIKMLVSPEKGARMSVGEALTNLVFAPITDLKDVKCSANWMWAAKIDGEGEKLYAACKSMCDIMAELGIAVDGGKDSLSMIALLKGESSTEVIKSPGTLVISAYAQCTNITKVVTPDLKCPSDQRGALLHINFGSASYDQKFRLGGSALAQCFSQLGDNCSDLDHVETFINAFNVTQRLIRENLIISGHDISDGGFITAILEMAFAGNCGISLDLKTTT
uniref:Phosphoribosylformylglycinamidine synthase n=1 Tax=Romanomermis culicivorax TaxID=13658 RepID=A0A915KCY2_ROMCU